MEKIIKCNNNSGLTKFGPSQHSFGPSNGSRKWVYLDAFELYLRSELETSYLLITMLIKKHPDAVGTKKFMPTLFHF